MFSDSFDSYQLWPWLGIPLILLSAGGAIGLIILATRHALKSLMTSTADAIKATGVGMMAAPEQQPLVTIGLGEVPWRQGGRRLTVVRRSGLSLVGGEPEDPADWINGLARRLTDQGVDVRDLDEEEPTRIDQGPMVQVARITVRDPSIITAVLDAGREAGFQEDQSAGREEVLFEDALATAGDRAMKDAMDSIDTLSANLGLPPSEFDVMAAELETLSAPAGKDGEVKKKATVRWRRQAA